MDLPFRLTGIRSYASSHQGRYRNRYQLGWIVALLLGAVLDGCSSPHERKAPIAESSSLIETARSIDQIVLDLNAVSVALNRLRSQPGDIPVDDWNAFGDALDVLQTQAILVGAHANRMRRSSIAFLAQWENELVRSSPEGTSERAEAQRVSDAARLKKLRADYLAVSSEFTGFLAVLREVRSKRNADQATGRLRTLVELQTIATREAEWIRVSLERLATDFRSIREEGKAPLGFGAGDAEASENQPLTVSGQAGPESFGGGD